MRILRPAASLGRSGAPAPKAIIAPHAGYVYSGPIAGTVYAAAAGALHRHRARRPARAGASRARRGLAASSAEAFATPLGEVPIDRVAVRDSLRHSQVHVLDAAHAAEHSLEVQLPFLQRVLGDFELVPFAVGAATHARGRRGARAPLGRAETLVVVSSDLSHYYDYATAARLDARHGDAIESLHAGAARTGVAPAAAIPVGGLLIAAQRHGLRATGSTCATRAIPPARARRWSGTARSR